MYFSTYTYIYATAPLGPTKRQKVDFDFKSLEEKKQHPNFWKNREKNGGKGAFYSVHIIPFHWGNIKILIKIKQTLPKPLMDVDDEL